MLQHSNSSVGGFFFGGVGELFFLVGVLVVAAILFRHIVAGGPGFRGALPHATWLGAAAAGRKFQTHLSLELRDLLCLLSLAAMPGH